MHGQQPPSVQAHITVQSKPEVGAGREVGGARKKRNDLVRDIMRIHKMSCLLYTSDAADEEDSVDLGGRRIIKKNHSV